MTSLTRTTEPLPPSPPEVNIIVGGDSSANMAQAENLPSPSVSRADAGLEVLMLFRFFLRPEKERSTGVSVVSVACACSETDTLMSRETRRADTFNMHVSEQISSFH